MSASDISGVDWELWIRRPDLPIFFTSMWFQVEGPASREVCGGGYSKQLTIHDGDMEWWIRSTSDLRSLESGVRAFFNSHSREEMAAIFERAEAVARGVTPYIEGVRARSRDELLKGLEDIVAGACEIMLYTTSIPAFFINGLETAKEGEVKEYEYIHMETERLRATSHYRRVRTEALAKLLEAIAERFGIAVHEAEALTLDEVRTSVTNDTLCLPVEILRQRSHCMYWDVGNGIEFTFDLVQIEDMKKAVSHQVEPEAPEVRGAIGNKGNVHGIVRIVHSEREMEKVLTGDILVAHSTNPALLPAMIRAAAFVTDEGGIGSHAAIVARELGKPCVIGTKCATQVFKDGDTVEVNADEGIVRKI